jgi:hypothetical protein
VSSSRIQPHSPTPALLSCPHPAAATTGDSVAFTSVHNGSPLDYGDQVTGKVTLAAQHHLWILTYASSLDRWYILGEIRDQHSGPWTSMPLYLGDGSGDDNGSYFCLAALAVDPTTNTVLNKPPGEANWLTQLPTATADIIAVQLRHGEKNTSANRPPSSCPHLAATITGDSVAFTSVHNGSPLDYGDRVSGKVTLAAQHHLWILAYSPDPRLWYILGDVPNQRRGTWISMPITLGDGSGQDDGSYFCLAALAVDPTSHTILRHQQYAGVPRTQLPTATADIIAVRLRHGERTVTPH